MEKFDLLKPPLFGNSHSSKTYDELTASDWIASFNLWIVREGKNPSLLYQLRGKSRAWAPGKLDVPVGGKISAGETVVEGGLREAKEEIGKSYKSTELSFIGRRLNVNVDADGKIINTVPHIYFVLDNTPLTGFKILPDELDGLYECNIDSLMKLHEKKITSFLADGIDSSKKKSKLSITSELFPENWANYHHKIAHLAKRFVEGEEDLIY
ncbi:MAG TPA: NUDIX domain-containing protein [bacterium]|nr:NUDIX domain-containing protein [bacterium]